MAAGCNDLANHFSKLFNAAFIRTLSRCRQISISHWWWFDNCKNLILRSTFKKQLCRNSWNLFQARLPCAATLPASWAAVPPGWIAVPRPQPWRLPRLRWTERPHPSAREILWRHRSNNNNSRNNHITTTWTRGSAHSRAQKNGMIDAIFVPTTLFCLHLPLNFG